MGEEVVVSSRIFAVLVASFPCLIPINLDADGVRRMESSDASVIKIGETPANVIRMESIPLSSKSQKPPEINPTEWISVTNAELRTWNPANGTNVEARLVMFNGQSVILRSADGRQFRVWRAVLPTEDLAILKGIEEEKLAVLLAVWEKRQGELRGRSEQAEQVNEAVVSACIFCNGTGMRATKKGAALDIEPCRHCKARPAK
jgi:hypothetical protein